MKIKALHINNFKFFPRQDPDSPLLRINGKNLLIYGENGSGKSTIYWALYTLLESAFKGSNAKVEKYFVRGESSLVNIYAGRNPNAHIKVVLDDAGATEYLVSGVDAEITTIRANAAIRESGMASDFINYRVLFRLHHAKHTSDNNLFEWFEGDILPYIRTSGGNTFLELLDDIRKGPHKVQDLLGNEIYSNASMLNDPDPGMRQNYRYYSQWVKRVARWKKELSRFLGLINVRANEILDVDFKQKIELKIELIAPQYNVLASPIDPLKPLDNLRWVEPEIRIITSKYDGKKNVVKRAHSFLNEAKWTAIGLSIRLAILEDTVYRPNPVQLKCLILDDMLLSLDMGNRDIVLNLLLDRYVQDYQMILMTHDRYFFELAKGKINARNVGNNWLKLEMYEDVKGGKPQPFILESKTNLEKADSFFRQKEFAAAANFMRKATECFVSEFLPKRNQYDGNFKQLDLSKLINRSRALARASGWPAQIISDLDLMRTNIFNPGSHYDVYTPVFQNDLKRAIETLKDVAVRSGINL
ncbi:MAG: AAA family ATPase [Taibaiella sp.]|nr:AAA family ATPase [Taibaiella sp.]